MSPIDLSRLTYANIFPPTLLIRKLVDDSTRDHYKALCDRLHTIGNKAGTGSNGFKLRKQEIMAVQPNIAGIIRVMESSKYIRPLLALWNETPSHTLNFPVPFVGELVAHIDKLALQSRRGRLGRLALFELCNLFFRFYDDLNCIKEISDCLNTHLRRYQPNEKIMGLDNVREHIHELISTSGHKVLAKTALDTGQHLPEVADHYNIPLQNSRFYEKALLTHYLARLNQLAPNEDAQILHEIVAPGVYNIKLDHRFRFGHKIITTLMDKLIDAGREPSPLWRDVILHIAGDPRIPPNSPSYSQWWAAIDSKYPQTMRGWLAKADLELFLRIMADYAKNQGNAALQRMYPERERFLRGLFKKGLIKETRLFLGRNVLRFINNPGSPGQSPAYVQIKDGGETAIFYLNLGEAHLIEGSYNCAMRMMDRIPQRSCLNGFPKAVYNRALRTGLEEQYCGEFGDDSRYYEVRHYQGWQSRAVGHLKKMGVQIYLSDVI
ncbi:EH signature domain-containing protein [Desulfovibrio sp. ZJ200]|uniref:EH signature domain-containing protein n=1 Tax=Desulfovibrio sp. ZJ200 TaxID=2709792 RepID=UPI0013EA1C15|nr:EH signature domain-containing protein [Desulfovibrio sp. ZJ200]